jgi:hypothetical protein
MEKLLGGELEGKSLSIVAKSPVELNRRELEALRRFSEGRPPKEYNYCVAGHPEILPDGLWFSGNVTIDISAAASPTKPVALATSLLNTSSSAVEITLGPTFIYEYAMMMMDAVGHDHPDVEVTGGLDCANGWTFGCTYASTLYPFVKVPLSESIEDSHERLWNSPFLGRPFLKGGFNGMRWYKTKKLVTAKEIQFADAGRLLVDGLDTALIAPMVEAFVNAKDQASLEDYRTFLGLLDSTELSRTKKRDLSLVYVSLPDPSETALPVIDELWKKQLKHTAELYPEGEEAAKGTEPPTISLVHRIAWLGLDDQRQGHLALWVRPGVSMYAQGIIDEILRVSLRAI